MRGVHTRPGVPGATRAPRRRLAGLAGQAGAALALVGCLAAGPLSARAEEGAAPGQASQKVPAVGLDALLKLPDAVPSPAPDPRKGGYTRSQWHARFAQARKDLGDAQARLEAAQGQLEQLASGGSAWQVAAPGAGAANTETGPLSYSLREEIRRSREQIDATTRALEELRVEANLAGVPPEWTGEPTTPVAPALQDETP